MAGRLCAQNVVVYTTASGTPLRLAPTDTLTFEEMAQPSERDICVFVDPSRSFQTLMGIGGALTDASAEVFAKLSKPVQAQLLLAYYSRTEGIGYSLARTNINSCDFSSDTYTYVADGDTTLKTFSLAHDLRYRIPFIRQAIAAAGGRLPLFTSPWSPPGWMKTNGEMLHGGKLKPEYYQAWANYMARFIKAYEKVGIPVWGTTIQNEPMATQTWESCIYSAIDERDFLKNNLGPTFARDGLASKKIIVWDHNRDLIYQQASTILADPAAAKYAWGVGFHWYEDWSGGDQQFDNVALVHETFPSKALMLTEGCIGPFNFDSLHSWSLGERYGRSMIHDFNNGAVGWTDWNILLDEQGGPNHVSNFCFAPVHADLRTGQLIFTNSYYYIGHFSKFIRPGARRVISSSSRSALETTAFLNADGKLAVVVLNRTDDHVPYWLWIHGRAACTVSPPHSIQTIVISNKLSPSR